MSISQKHYQVGYALCIARQPLTACQNDAQRRGWWACLDAEAECATAGYAGSDGLLMATQYVFAIGKMIAGQPATVTVDSRLAELLDWQCETGKRLPMAADLILWLEDRGFVVDLLTGCTERLEPLQKLIDEALAPPTRDERAGEAAALADTARYYEWLKAEREDYADYVADVDWLRHGC